MLLRYSIHLSPHTYIDKVTEEIESPVYLLLEGLYSKGPVFSSLNVG